MKYTFIYIGIALFIVMNSVAVGDTVVLSDGKRLSGEITKLSSGALVFRTSLAGQVIVPIEEVRAIDTDSEVLVSFNDGTEVTGRLVAYENMTDLESDEKVLIHSLDLAAVSKISNDLPEEQTEGEDVSLETSIETGVYWRSGEEDYTGPFARLTLKRESELFGFDSTARIEHSSDADFPSYFTNRTDFKIGNRDGLYPHLALELERNVDRALEIGSNLTLGVGKTMYESTNHKLEATAGLGFSYDYFDSSDVPDSYDLLIDGEGHDADLNLRLQLRHSTEFLGNSSIAGELTLWESLTDLGDFRARTESSLLLGLTPSLQLKLDIQVDFDEDIHFKDIEKWQTSVGASIRWKF